MLNAQINQLLDVHVQIPRFSVGYRMALIWKHVSENYPDFKWYARFWDDNYVIPSTFEALIPSSFTVSSPLEIGRLALANEGGLLVPVTSEALINEAMHPYIDGGAGFLLSHGGIKCLTDGPNVCFTWFSTTMWRQSRCGNAWRTSHSACARSICSERDFNAPSACIMTRTTCRTRPNTCADTNRTRMSTKWRCLCLECFSLLLLKTCTLSTVSGMTASYWTHDSG